MMKHRQHDLSDASELTKRQSDVQFRLRCRRSTISEEAGTGGRAASSSGGSGSGGGGGGGNGGGPGASPYGGVDSLISLSKPNSVTSSNMTASVVVNLPASYANSSDLEYASPSLPSTPQRTSEQQQEVRISFL
ncbi:unnamed protein product [Bemisia tabaci]|uniref:Uncharacterized protein n=1 Tax=Bemisia tabaci TaxID=7038 RepID=A0A9P0EXN9_BEMTA|nr:unnamed protein product [Bemisia tabaci]